MEPCQKGWITQNMIKNQLRPDTRGALEPLNLLGSYEGEKMGNCRLLTLALWDRMIEPRFSKTRVPRLLLLGQLPR